MLAQRLRQVYEMQNNGGVAMGAGKIKKCSKWYKAGEKTKKGKVVEFDDDYCKKYKYQPGVTRTGRKCIDHYKVGAKTKSGTIAKTKACKQWEIIIPVVLEKGDEPVMLSLPAAPVDLASLKGKKIQLKSKLANQTLTKKGPVKLKIKKAKGTGKSKTGKRAPTPWNIFMEIQKQKHPEEKIPDISSFYGKNGKGHNEYLSWKSLNGY